MTVTGLVFAGGKSRRMGQDKATMFGGVERICTVLRQAGVDRVVVLAGTEERAALFSEEAVPDPEGASGLHEVIRWAKERFVGSLLLAPCDAFLLDEKAVRFVLKHKTTGAVPLDEMGHRQPLFALIPGHMSLVENAESVGGLLAEVPSLHPGPHAKAFTNFNTLDEVARHRLEHRSE
jgi:molybdopterin-guanine dinucleotide biosynthesis protein A